MELGESLVGTVYTSLSNINTVVGKIVTQNLYFAKMKARRRTPNIMLTFRNLDNFRI